MRYKNPNDEGKPKTRELRRLWEIEIFAGDREDPDCPTRVETVIAWNEVEAIRLTGDKAVNRPKMICWVTWPEHENGPMFRINSPQQGPLRDQPVVPTVADTGEKEDW